jgi:hypothetical protein
MSDFESSNNAIILAAITVMVTSGLFIIKEFVIERRREKRIAKRKAIEDRLEAYGRLALILEATKQKIERQGLDKNNPDNLLNC